ENVPNQTIYATMNLLNREFNKQNRPIENVHPAFKNNIADVNIEFRLATIDPEGNCTSGIIRHADPELSYCNTLDCNLRAKARYMWPRDKYMNCHIVGSIQTSGGGVVQGFSHFPFAPFSTADTIDSNAMIYSVLPTNLNDQGGGRTSVTTHEVGHWLGLYHTWGKTDNVADPSSCSDDDEVHDTPNCIGLQSVCILDANTCGAGQPGDTIDNAQNFMEYSQCFAMFTNGQANRMRAVLENIPHRMTVVSQQNLQETGITGNETFGVCQADFMPNFNYRDMVICPGQSVTFSDLSFHNVKTREWYFDGAYPSRGDDSTVTVTYNLPGTYSVRLTVSDGVNSSNKTIEQMIRVIDGEMNGFPYRENLEAANSMADLNYLVNNPDGDVTFEVNTQTGNLSRRSLYINQNDFPTIGKTDELLSGTFDLSGLQSPVLTFDYAFATRKIIQGTDEINVYISNDCGLSWIKRKSIKGTTLRTAEPTNNAFIPAEPNQWKKTVVNLNGYAKKNTRFRIEFISGGGNNVFIDNIEISDVTDINDITAASFAQVYPNPVISTESFRVVSSLPMASIRLFDITGREVSIGAIKPIENESEYEVYSSQMSPGSYVVRLTTVGGLEGTKLLVVQ
ncbi:MAG TPA: M43 family zinc metalloprotease, partial [Luteibaculaceae bacterium]|nr:M43 family zinc metalloprotease [Luteibaculaceae bacterium]